MKKILCLALLCLLLVRAGAAAPYYVTDGAELLDPQDRAALETAFSQDSQAQGYDIAALTTPGMGDNPHKYAAQYYADHGFANDGILLVICEARGQWYIYTSGLCAQAIGESGAAEIGAAIGGKLESGDYSGAISAFADHCKALMADKLEAVDAQQDAQRRTNNLLLSLGALMGLAAGVVVCILLTRKFLLPKPRS